MADNSELTTVAEEKTEELKAEVATEKAEVDPTHAALAAAQETAKKLAAQMQGTIEDASSDGAAKRKREDDDTIDQASANGAAPGLAPGIMVPTVGLIAGMGGGIGEVTEIVQCPQGLVGRIIGSGGATIKDLQMRSGNVQTSFI